MSGTESQSGWRRVLGLLAGIALIAAWCLTQAALAREYVVRPGESLWSIAERHMGSGARWADLYRANRGRVGADPRLIRPGMRLVLAPAEGRVAQTSARYRVRPGDSLWSIAERHLGRGEKWEALYARNRGSIGADPRLIRPGTVLVLGDAPAVAAAPRKAVKPAKPVARAPVAKPAKPVARAPVARPEAKAPAARPAVRNPFEYTGGTGAAQAPGAAGTPPGRNPFSFGGEGAPAAKSLPGQAQRRTGGMPVVPAYPDDSAAARRKGAPPVAVDHAGAKPVAKGKRGKHMASSPGPTPRKD